METLKKILRRTFSVDGGSFIRIREEDGSITATTIGAATLRLAFFLAAVFVLAKLGVPVEKALLLVAQLFGAEIDL